MFRGGIGPTEILLIIGVVLLLFGGRKLPELARGSGRALRIFKSEVKEMKDEDARAKSDVSPELPSDLSSGTSTTNVDETSRRPEQA